MYDKADIVRVLRKNLKSELDIINFYMDNAEKVNYSTNKDKIDTLVFDSFEHAKWLAREILKLDAEGNQLHPSIKETAMKEETGVKEIYRYELERTDIPEVQQLLKRLIAEEEKHEKLVDALE